MPGKTEPKNIIRLLLPHSMKPNSVLHHINKKRYKQPCLSSYSQKSNINVMQEKIITGNLAKAAKSRARTAKNFNSAQLSEKETNRNS